MHKGGMYTAWQKLQVPQFWKDINLYNELNSMKNLLRKSIKRSKKSSKCLIWFRKNVKTELLENYNA